jgi:hypothetical protein
MRSFVLAVVLPVVACSSSKKAVNVDANDGVDAPSECPGLATYTGALSNPSGLERCTDANGFYADCPNAMGTTQNPELIIAGGGYNNDKDALEIDLYNHLGLFTNGYMPVGGVDLSKQGNFHDCSICVLLDVGLSPTGGQYSDHYLATAGSLDITTISGAATISDTGHVTGSITGVTLVHVTIDTTNNTSTVINDGCTVSIPSATFDEVVDTTASNFAPPGKIRARITR